ncbi:MAG: 3'-5' exonuclease [Oscillospiraceae bacterium]|nr:3'-5' exonuclease [Oscillospiraceae bacterium]
MLNSLFSKFENIVVFDIETTGLNAQTDEIIELGAIHVVPKDGGYEVKQTLAALVTLSEGRSLNARITELTGITQEQLQKEGRPKAEVSRDFAELLKSPGTLLVAYNAQFDLNFIFHFLNKHKSAAVLKNVKLLDAMAVYKDRRDFPHKLSDAVTAYGFINENAHRAVDDAQATLDVLAAMGREKDDLDKYINLFGYNPKYGVSGTKISSVTYKPQGYDRSAPLYEV